MIALIISLISPTIIIQYFLHKLRPKLTASESIITSFFLGQLTLITLTFLVSLLFGLSKNSILAVIYLSAISALSILYLKYPAFLSEKSPIAESIKKNTYLISSLAIFSIIFFILLHRHTLPFTPNGLFTPHNTYGDIPYHLAIINSISHGNNLPPQNPIYSGIRLSYPFLIDFHSAALIKLGLNLQTALILPSLFFGFCLFALFFTFAFRFLSSQKQAFLALCIFLLNGGWGGYYLLQKANNEFLFIPGLAKYFTQVIDQYNFRFPNSISSVFMAERPLLVGLAASFLVFNLLWISFNQKKSQAELALAGFTVGLLPLWHTHTLVAFGIIMPAYAICLAFRRKQSLLKIISTRLRPFIYFAIPLAFLGMVWHLEQVFSPGTSFFGIQIGWIAGTEGIIEFWFNNLGLFIPLLFLGLLTLTKTQTLFYLPFLGLFIASNIIKFQPFDWDNYKVLLIWYAVSSIIVVKLLHFLSQKIKSLGKLFAISIFAHLCFSGILLIIGNHLTWHQVFSSEQIALASWLQKNSFPQDVLLTGPEHNHFAVLAGRKILLGYPGYLWTQGINYHQRQQDIHKIYAGNQNLLKKYPINFVVIGPASKSAYKINQDYWQQNFSLVKSSSHYQIYKVE